ncbi:MAG TPA: hypothetical protein IGS53_21980 [Leptolyngbyaceae cyanobacterium M33_DOE_097]|nr:hypothetical protein [Leptolyngbyaceae cyanobacterium M33_DOE_097]
MDRKRDRAASTGTPNTSIIAQTNKIPVLESSVVGVWDAESLEWDDIYLPIPNDLTKP